MKNENEFPIALLLESKKKRWEYFVNKVIAHPKLTRVYDELLELVDQLPAGSLIFVYGPTGIGKTTLGLHFVKHIFEMYKEQIELDPGHIPVASMEIALADSDMFSWKDYYQRALMSMDAHFIGKGIKFSTSTKTSKYLGGDNRESKYGYRLALEQEFAKRTTRFFVVDEAQHLKRIASGRRLLNQMDVLKSLANITKVTHILIGTYELTMDSLSAQIDRRSTPIHFSRYHYDIQSELSEFRNIIFSFQKQMPLPVQPDLVSQTDFLYENSLGCVGVLKELLNKALKKALKEGKETITNTILKSQSLSTDKLIGMARAIKEGEEALKDKGNSPELRSLLGMDTLSTKKRQPTKNPRATKKQKPFQRKPSRDKTGTNEPAI